MSRPIKFRAWDNATKRMWYPSVVAADGRNIALVNQFGVETADRQSDPLMQFTGLLDKNGKEIYEGDIVRFDNTDIGGTVVIGEIMFNQDTTLANLEWGLWTKNGYLSTDFLGWIEILGNVYENPELVEK